MEEIADQQDLVLTSRRNKSRSSQLSIPDKSVSAVGKPQSKKTKVKTGCYTCKYRRVKCDESRPFCQRCIKFGVDCDGYPPTAKAGPTRALLPKSQQALLPQVLERPTIYQLHSGPRFEDDQEGRCFRLYVEEVASQIQGPFKSPLWDQLIPQASEAEPFIRHAIVAIGAVGKIMQEQKMLGLVAPPQLAHDYPYALNQFNKALQGMRTAITNGIADIKKALIACILVFCFETMGGKPGSALINAESGLLLLHQWMKSNMSQGASFFLSKEWQQQRIEDGIMNAFAALDLHLLFFLDTRPEHVHEFMVEGGNRAIAKMPPVFSSLKIVRSFWSLLMRRNYHFIKLALMRGQLESGGPPDKYDNFDTAYGDSANMVPGGNIHATVKYPQLEMIPESLRYLEDGKRWVDAAKPVFKNIYDSGTQEEKVLCALLEVHHLMNEIILQGAFFSLQTEFDQFLGHFRRMLSLGTFIYTHVAAVSATNDPYHFDAGIIPVFFIVGMRCRDRAIRDAVLEILFKVHYREGMWDSWTTAEFIKWVKELEDPARDENDYVPEYARAIITNCYVDMEVKMAILSTAINCKGVPGGERRYLEKTVFWP